MNSGQVCTAIKRDYVEERVFDDNAPHHRRVNELVTDARARSARVHAGGGPIPGIAYFYEPTIVTDVADDPRLVAEEQFGPAAASRQREWLSNLRAMHVG